MSEDIQRMIESYAKLKEEHARLQEEIDRIAPMILQYMQEEIDDGNRISTDYGTFSIGVRCTYNFPAELTEKEAQIKQQKKLLIQTGKVEPQKETQYIIFRSKK